MQPGGSRAVSLAVVALSCVLLVSLSEGRRSDKLPDDLMEIVHRYLKNSTAMQRTYEQLHQMEIRLKLLETQIQTLKLHSSRDCFTASTPLPRHNGVSAQFAAAPPWLLERSTISPDHILENDTVHAAAERGDVESLRRLLVKGANAQARDANGDTALHLAAGAGLVAPLDTLLWFGADPRARGRGLRTPLHGAAAHGHLRAVESLLRAGAALDARDAVGATALSLAAQHNHTYVHDFLLQKVAEKDSPLLSAVRRGRWDLTVDLTQRGASPVERGADAATPLLLAARADRADVVQSMFSHWVCDATEVQRALEEAGGGDAVWALAQVAPELVAGAPGKAALRRAASDCRQQALMALLDARADPSGENEDVVTALQFSAEAGKGECVTLLLQRNVESDRKEDEIRRVLNVTLSATAIKILVRNATDIIRGNFGGSVLRRVAKEGCKECIEVLLSAGVDAEQTDEYGKTALDLASQGGRADCAALLLTQHRKIYPTENIIHETTPSTASRYVVPETNAEAERALRDAAKRGRLSELNALLISGVNPDSTDARGDTALVLAAEEGHTDCVVRLLREGANKEATVVRGYGGWTALHRASSEGQLAVVRVLVAAGANLEAKTTAGNTPLIEASYYGYIEVVRTLLDAGANVNAKGDQSWTALHKAAYRDHIDVVRLLLRKGADKRMKDASGNTAFNYARGAVRILLET